MTPDQFCYWLHGFFEITGGIPQGGLTFSQSAMIKDHLELVFAKVTPDRNSEDRSDDAQEWKKEMFRQRQTKRIC